MIGLQRVPRGWLLVGVSAVFGLLLAACGGPMPAPKDAERGRALYAANCLTCHGDAASAVGAAPEAPSHGIEGHTWHHADGQLTEIILGKLEYPGRTMPSFENKLSEQDIQEILAFFKTNWLPEQRSSQREASQNWEQSRGAR